MNTLTITYRGSYENGRQIADRTVRFGIEGGKVTFVLEKIIFDVTVPLPEPQLQFLPVQPVPLPELELMMHKSTKFSLLEIFTNRTFALSAFNGFSCSQ